MCSVEDRSFLRTLRYPRSVLAMASNKAIVGQTPANGEYIRCQK
jgi:hypothetical protein